MSLAKNIKAKVDTPEERKRLKEEYGYFALFLAAASALFFFLYWKELGHLYGVAVLGKILIWPLIIGGIGFLAYKNDSKLEKWKWVILVVWALLMFLTFSQAAEYRQNKKAGIHWDKDYSK